MNIPWPIGLTIIAIEILFLYAISKHYERQLNEQEEKEVSKLKEYDNYNS